MQIKVPNGAASTLRYKPTVMVSLAEPRTYFPEETGLSTTIPDATLGGTFTFSAGGAVDWTRRIVYSLSYVTFAPLLAVADTTPPVLSLPTDETVDATGPTGAVVCLHRDRVGRRTTPTPAVTCKPPTGITFPLGATTGELHGDRRERRRRDRLVRDQGEGRRRAARRPRGPRSEGVGPGKRPRRNGGDRAVVPRAREASS